MTLDQSIDRLAATALQVKAERDRLLTALKAMRSRWGRHANCSDPLCCVCPEEARITQMADDAIAEAEGQ